MALASRNEVIWAQTSTRTELMAEGWSDPGERSAILGVAERARGRRILDVGIGTGRTTSLLLLLSKDYVGIDYIMEMVDAARARHPGVDLRHADARDLSEFDDASFDLVNFSYSGIDAVGHEDRRLIFAAFHRVLRPGGCLLFSTLNLDGAAPRERPWHLNPETPWRVGSLQPSGGSGARLLIRVLLKFLRRPADPFREMLNWFRVQRKGDSGADWLVGPMSAHRFGLRVHFTTLAGLRRELAEHHFAIDEIFGSDDGEVIADGESSSTDWWFHAVATPIPS